MTFKEFCKWSHDRACDGCWSGDTAKTCCLVIATIQDLAFWKLRSIRLMMGEPELLAHLAEECNELAHAAMKLRRTMINGNPTPVCHEEAAEKFAEEVADVYLVLNVLNVIDWMELVEKEEAKAERWLQRLEENIR